MIAHSLAEALGVDRAAPATMVAEYLLRQADVLSFGTRLSTRTAEWLVLVGAELHTWSRDRPDKALDDIARLVAEEMILRLHRADAPNALSVVAPNQMVPSCKAGELDRVCRGLVARHLPGFCRAILATWESDGQLALREP